MHSFILFLDFDGVLSPGNTGTLRHAAALAALLEEFPATRVVLSTNWRESEPLEELVGWLPPALARRVVGATPVLPGGHTQGGRQRECEEWLRVNPAVRWLAVDDTVTLFDGACPWLFETSSRCALDANALSQLRIALYAAGAA